MRWPPMRLRSTTLAGVIRHHFADDGRLPAERMLAFRAASTFSPASRATISRHFPSFAT